MSRKPFLNHYCCLRPKEHQIVSLSNFLWVVVFFLFDLPSSSFPLLAVFSCSASASAAFSFGSREGPPVGWYDFEREIRCLCPRPQRDVTVPQTRLTEALSLKKRTQLFSFSSVWLRPRCTPPMCAEMWGWRQLSVEWSLLRALCAVELSLCLSALLCVCTSTTCSACERALVIS